MLHCFQCGRDMPDNLAYCLNCGTRLDDEAETVVHPEPTPFPPVPQPKQGSGALKLILGGLLGAVAVILVLAIVAVVLFTRRDDQPPLNVSINNTNIEAPTKTPTPRKPTPSPTVSTVNENTEPKTMDRECRITNPQGGSVNLRRNCDTRDCSMDASTLHTQGDPGETVIPTGRKPVTTGRFTWVQVKYGGDVLWISSTRMDCG